MMTTRTLRASAGLLAFALLIFAAHPALAQRGNDEPRPSPNAKVSQTIGTTEIDMHYGRPGVKGREVFGGLQKWDEVWRAGANEPTTITLSGDVTVEGESLEAGTYNIFMRPRQNGAWEVIFTTPVRWGTMFNQATPVLSVEVDPEEGPHQEWLQYRWEDLSEDEATLVMHWDDTLVPLRFAVD